MPADELDDALLTAEILDGKLPHWQRGRGDGEACAGPEGPDLARALEDERRAAAGLPPLAEDPPLA